MNAGPSAEDREADANTVAALYACAHGHAPYLVWHAYRVLSFDGVRDDKRRGRLYITAAVLRAYQMAVGDDAPRSSGHALKSISLLADKPPRSPLVPPTTFLFL